MAEQKPQLIEKKVKKQTPPEERGMNLALPQPLVDAVRAFSDKSGLTLAIVREAVEAAVLAAFYEKHTTNPDVSKITQGHLFPKG